MYVLAVADKIGKSLEPFISSPHETLSRQSRLSLLRRQWLGLNQLPIDLQSIALPNELHCHVCSNSSRESF